MFYEEFCSYKCFYDKKEKMSPKQLTTQGTKKEQAKLTINRRK